MLFQVQDAHGEDAYVQLSVCDGDGAGTTDRLFARVNGGPEQRLLPATGSAHERGRDVTESARAHSYILS